MKATLVGELTGRIYHSSCKPYLKEKGVTKEAVRKIAKEYKTIRRRAKDIGAKNMTSAYVMGIYFVAMNRESGLSAEENYEVFYQGLAHSKIMKKFLGDGDSYLAEKRLPGACNLPVSAGLSDGRYYGTGVKADRHSCRRV